MPVANLRGVQMHPLLAAINVFLCTYLHESTAVACSKQQPGTDTHSHISFLLISRRLSRPRISSRHSVRTSSYSLLGSYDNNYVHHKCVYTPEVGVATQNFLGALCAPVLNPLSKFLNPSLHASFPQCISVGLEIFIFLWLV